MSGAVEALDGVRRFRPYSEYKASGVARLGEVPACWELRRLKHAASINDEALGEDTAPDRPIEYVDIGSVRPGFGITKREWFVYETAPSRARRLVRDGDVVVSTVRTYLRAIAPIKTPSPDLVVSSGFAVVRPGADLSGEFAAYALQAPYFVEEVVANSVGVSFPAINAREMACFPIALPRLNEQRAIAEFLDRETGKIDALVAKKERLIELLQEKRTALITHAVTKGLDPTAPTKPSGIDWLGDIPAHWETVTLGRLCCVGNGSTPRRERSEFWQGGDYPWLTSTKINDQIVESADQFVTKVALHECHLPIVEPNSLLMAITGEGQTRGRVALLKIEATISQHLAYISPRDSRLLAQFLRRVLEAQYEWLRLESSGTGSTRAALTCDYVKSIVIPLPSEGEQHDVCDRIEVGISLLNPLLERVKEGIERLREFRTALISAAVTGKIDVREEVARVGCGDEGTASVV